MGYSLRNILTVICLQFLINLLTIAGPGHAQCPPIIKFYTDRIAWNNLSYETKNFFATIKVDIHLEILTAKESKKTLIPIPENTTSHTSSFKTLTITVQSVINPFIGPTDYIQNQAWYGLENATALQRIRQRQNKNDWQKTYLFTDNGVSRLRKKPNNPTEINLPIELWTNIEKSFYPYDLNNIEHSSVLEPSALMILVSLVDFSIGSEPLNLCVFNKKQQIGRAHV